VCASLADVQHITGSEHAQLYFSSQSYFSIRDVHVLDNFPSYKE
jgi:hypothetical protein